MEILADDTIHRTQFSGLDSIARFGELTAALPARILILQPGIRFLS